MRKTVLALVVLVLLLVYGCGDQQVFDASSEETMQQSFEEMTQDMAEHEVESLKEAISKAMLMDIIEFSRDYCQEYGELPEEAEELRQVDDLLELHKVHILSADEATVHGMTLNEIHLETAGEELEKLEEEFGEVYEACVAE